MVESIKIYNENLDERYLFDMENATYLLYEGGIDWGNLDVKHDTYQYTHQIGETIVDTTIGTRDVSISGWIIGKSEEEINKKKKKLSVIINPLHNLHIEIDKWELIGKATSNVVYSSIYKENNNKMCKFLIQIFCANPMFQEKNRTEKILSSSIGLFHFPLILKQEGIPMSYRTVNYFLDVINDGATDIGCEFVLTARGQVNNPTIRNINTGEFLAVNYIMHSGDEIRICTEKGKRSILNQYNESLLDYLDFDSTWMQLVLGTNTFTYFTTLNDERDESYKNMDLKIRFCLNLMNLSEE